MLPVQWNTLRVGDAVFVHESDGTLVSAVVAVVRRPDAEGDANDIAVRIEDLDECAYMWPSSADVHSDPVEVSEACVQCGLIAL